MISDSCWRNIIIFYDSKFLFVFSEDDHIALKTSVFDKTKLLYSVFQKKLFKQKTISIITITEKCVRQENFNSLITLIL